jgi:hypothetical protein
MFEFAAGVALGAAFAPFWMMIWNAVKPSVVGLFTKKTP